MIHFLLFAAFLCSSTGAQFAGNEPSLSKEQANCTKVKMEGQNPPCGEIKKLSTPKDQDTCCAVFRLFSCAYDQYKAQCQLPELTAQQVKAVFLGPSSPLGTPTAPQWSKACAVHVTTDCSLPAPTREPIRRQEDKDDNKENGANTPQGGHLSIATALLVVVAVLAK